MIIFLAPAIVAKSRHFSRISDSLPRPKHFILVEPVREGILDHRQETQTRWECFLVRSPLLNFCLRRRYFIILGLVPDVVIPSSYVFELPIYS